MIPKTQMEFDYYISPDGATYSFQTGDNMFLMSQEGYGMPPIEYIRQRGPFQHGETIIDYRLQPRVIQLVHRRQANCRGNYWDNRCDILNVLRPNRQAFGSVAPGKLRKVYYDGSYTEITRDLDVYLEQGPAFAANVGNWDEWAYTETIRFIAPDPTFYDPDQVCQLFTFDNVVRELVFPITFPIKFGEYGTAQIGFYYYGTWLTYPKIQLTGPMVSPVITQISTGEKLEFDYEIKTNETVSISLNYGNKRVVNNTGKNLIGTLTSDSNLATFHIAPSPEVSNGYNEMEIFAYNMDDDSDANISYYTRYIGI